MLTYTSTGIENFFDRHCCNICRSDFDKNIFKSYDHENGIHLEGFDKPQWIYKVCPKCGQEVSVYKALDKKNFGTKSK